MKARQSYPLPLNSHLVNGLQSTIIPIPTAIPKITAPQLQLLLPNAATPVNTSAVVVVALALPVLEELEVVVGPKPPMMIEPKGSVLLPITKSEAAGASDTLVPLTVIADPPGTSVWLPTTYCEALSGVIGWLLMVRTGATEGAKVMTGG